MIKPRRLKQSDSDLFLCLDSFCPVGEFVTELWKSCIYTSDLQTWIKSLTVHDFHNSVKNSPTGQKESKHNNKSESDYLRLLGLIIVNCTQQWWWSIYHCWILMMKTIKVMMVTIRIMMLTMMPEREESDSLCIAGAFSTAPLLLHFSSTSPPLLLHWDDLITISPLSMTRIRITVRSPSSKSEDFLFIVYEQFQF